MPGANFRTLHLSGIEIGTGDIFPSTELTSRLTLISLKAKDFFSESQFGQDRRGLRE